MFLRQATASQEILLGPFVDDADGKTAETALTISNIDIKLWKGGAATEVNVNSGSASHIASGRYSAVLDAADTDTVGMLEVNVHVSGALPVRRQYYVLNPAVFDALFAASSAGYQVPIWANAASTVNLNATTINSLTNLPAIPANWLTAAGIATGAFTSAKFASGAFDAVWSVATRTLTAISDSSGVTTLLSRILGTLAAGTHSPQSGDSFTRIGAPSGVSVSADIQTRLPISGYTAPPTAGAIRAEIDTNSTQLAKLGTPSVTLAADIAAVKTDTATASAEVVKIPRKATAIVAGASVTKTNTSVTPNQTLTEVLS